ncbi:hypothetical protein TRIATDRAFT_86486 [Trichoderma atroviride IMI 206040]|uniref:Uncharacterized protein n=1 Tax=Hypocrea atroviridis (strain ATCC 20476 / IMI 206040) TaxID=452589 RepID=G9P250_HYPAI|nr:uncharacterized protein TRIATDRAFT_86486 [Trichoderma atroviride IMI 206040]EHK42645.1 hypothetical protein TRIATDRAFT_86486 [Trichoderma atroviride IMI 206040]
MALGCYARQYYIRSPLGWLKDTAPRLPEAMSEYIRVAGPWEMVCMGFMSPISLASVEVHDYILINVDYLTRFLNATASVQSTAEELKLYVGHPEDGWSKLGVVVSSTDKPTMFHRQEKLDYCRQR